MTTSKIEITYFTDPYCSWCWATEPMLYRIRETYRDQVHLRYVMGGLVRDMAGFYDGLNDIRTTAEVAPHWQMVSERSGQPIDERLMDDITDPHFSTWPACIAVKAAQLQGETVGEVYLRRMRRAALTERKVISTPEIYETLAREIPGLDYDRFHAHLADGTARRAFEEDLAECARYGVTGFPTLLFRYVGQVALPGTERPILVGGHRSFATYRQVLQRLLPGLVEHPPRDIAIILAEYGPLTTRELAEVYARPVTAMRDEMETLQAASRGDMPSRQRLTSQIRQWRDGVSVERLPVHGGEFWMLLK